MTSADTTVDPTTPDTASGRSLTPALLVGGGFALTTVAQTLFHTAFSIWEIRDDFGAGGRSPEEQLPFLITLGLGGLLAALGVGKWLGGDKANRGAVVLGALSILTLPVFFSGAPASFGTMAAVRAGLTRGGTPARGAARGFGIVGIVVTVLIIIAIFGGNIAGMLDHATR
jgi:hypothetical protein